MKRKVVRIGKPWRVAMARCGLTKHDMARAALKAKEEGVASSDAAGMIHLCKSMGLARSKETTR